MRFFYLFVFFVFCLISCTRTIYVVRHAEKINPSDTVSKAIANDPPLSEAGKVRALVLRDELDTKHIKHIYSTNTLRTKSTAEPLSQKIQVKVEAYSNIDSLVQLIKSIEGNVLVVGHSNTVDDLVNKLCGETKVAGDLKDSEYDNLFVIKMRGKKISFEKHKYGYPSNP